MVTLTALAAPLTQLAGSGTCKQTSYHSGAHCRVYLQFESDPVRRKSLLITQATIPSSQMTCTSATDSTTLVGLCRALHVCTPGRATATSLLGQLDDGIWNDDVQYGHAGCCGASMKGTACNSALCSLWVQASLQPAWGLSAPAPLTSSRQA